MLRKILLSFFLILILGLLIPHSFVVPVSGATKYDYNHDTFWFYPWGSSGTHKGVDIFASKGTVLHSSTDGIVVACGNLSKGGTFILVLAPKWRLHYYAHLKSKSVDIFDFVNSGEQIGKVGNSGNAQGKQPHLHYSIFTLLPYPWKLDSSTQGWKKMFYINPIPLLDKAFIH